jgi:response regulator RpfG family c-di-GMP phosphodiesterase
MNEKTLILYVDDEFLNLKLFEVKFGSKYHILTAENGYKGLELLDKFPNIKIVISDMKMPEMNGIDFTIRAREKYPELNYYILTGYEINDQIKNAINTGLVKTCFCKPFNWIEISADIEKSVSG